MRPRASRVGPGRGFFRRPRGFIDDPRQHSEHARGPLYVRGWCLFPATTVARVEISLNGGAPELARLGVERQDVALYTNHRDAPICGWEHTADLPEGASSVTVEATAHSLSGERLRLAPVEISVRARTPASAADEEDAAGLRRRSMRPLRARAARHAGSPPRLLAFTHTLALGGASLYLAELLRRLHDPHGFECEVVTLAGGPLRCELERTGVPVHDTDAAPVTSMERYEGHIAELLAWAAPRGFDAVLVNTLSAFAGCDLAERLGVPAVWAVHESYALPAFWHAAYPPDVVHPYVRERAARALERADAVLFEAEATRRLFLGGARPERLVTLPYAIELGAVEGARGVIDGAAMRRRLGIAGDATVVLGLGTIERRKAQTMLAQAFSLIAGRHPRAHLVLVGETRDRHREGYQSALRDYVRRAGLVERVSIEPLSADPYAWHALADLLVCASDVESLPRAILEAMAFGKPVLSTSVFGVPELIEDGRTGYLCGTRDASALAAGLDRALSASIAERATIGEAAADHVRTHHDPARYASRVASLLRGVVADRAALPVTWLEPRETLELAP